MRLDNLIELESLGAVCLRALAVAKQHDFRAIRLNAEMFHVSDQHLSIAFALLLLIDHEIFEDRIWLIAIQRIQAESQKRSPADPIVYFQNKQKIMRISSYFFDPIFSDIYRRIWSNCANELTVKAR